MECVQTCKPHETVTRPPCTHSLHHSMTQITVDVCQPNIALILCINQRALRPRQTIALIIDDVWRTILLPTSATAEEMPISCVLLCHCIWCYLEKKLQPISILYFSLGQNLNALKRFCFCGLTKYNQRWLCWSNFINILLRVLSSSNWQEKHLYFWGKKLWLSHAKHQGRNEKFVFDWHTMFLNNFKIVPLNQHTCSIK